MKEEKGKGNRVFNKRRRMGLTGQNLKREKHLEAHVQSKGEKRKEGERNS